MSTERSFYTITRADVGRPTIRAFNRVWVTSDWIGRILPCDVGKRVYLTRGILQVENDEQRDVRLATDYLTGFEDSARQSAALLREAFPLHWDVRRLVRSQTTLLRRIWHARDPIYQRELTDWDRGFLDGWLEAIGG